MKCQTAYGYSPNGVINVVSRLDSSDNGICQKPILASSLLNTFPFEMFANISSVEGRTNLSLTINLLSSVKSPQMRICPDFLVTTTIGAHHSVASSTLDIIPFSSIVVNSFLTLLNNGNGTR